MGRPSDLSLPFAVWKRNTTLSISHEGLSKTPRGSDSIMIPLTILGQLGVADPYGSLQTRSGLGDWTRTGEQKSGVDTCKAVFTAVAHSEKQLSC